MSSEPAALFTITQDHLNTGLRGFPVGTCRTSSVDPTRGVFYVGQAVADLAYHDPEEIVFLLFHKRMPTAEELSSFKANLRSRGSLDPRVLDVLGRLPREGHPMEWLISGLNLLGMTSKTGDYREDALNLVAWAPELIAAIFRLRSGWGEAIAPRKDLGLIENFVHMLGVPGADPERLARLLRVFYVLHMDHGGGNLSTFVGKAVASSAVDTFAAIGAAMAALYGPLHGRANQDCLDFVRSVGSSDPGDVATFVRNLMESGGKIFGFGHAVLRVEDPRATIQYALGEELCPDDPLFRTAVSLRTAGVEVLKTYPKVSNPYPNVDAVSGSLLNACGLADSNYYTLLFGLSRISGIAAQIVDERLVFRGGKGVPIYRPKYIAESVAKG